MSAAQTETEAPPGPPTLRVEGPCATLAFNRPRHMNRVQPEDIDALLRLFDAVDADPSLRVLVITGTGRAFSAGYHLGDMQARAEGAGEGGGVPSFESMVCRLERVRVPTIARLNGGVYGGSTDLALACDFRVGHTGVEMVMPAARLGLHYYESGLRRYVSRLGMNTAKRLFLAAERLDAAEMLRVGYLTALVGPEALDAEVAALAGRIAALAPLAVQGMKRALNEIGHGALDLGGLRARIAACGESQDLREGLAAFRERREPAFRGR